jgi:3-oxoacyl-[acyl-carrier protein] reductase
VSDLGGKVYAITGAGGGIGAATARLLLARGAHVVRMDVKWPAEAKPVERERLVTLDVCDEAAVKRTFDELASAHRRLDGIATCAGIVDTSDFFAIDAARFRRVQDVNVLGTFLAIKHAAPHMKDGGRVVTIASVAGIRGGGLLGTAAYAASKGAVLALTKNAARVLGPRGITVNCIAPGPTDTAMTAPLQADPARKQRLSELVALGRSADPAEIGEAIVWLLSPQASFVSGSTLVVDGGIVMM